MIFSYLNLQGENKLFAVLIILSLTKNLRMSSLAKRISHFRTTTLSNSKSKTNQHTKPTARHQYCIIHLNKNTANNSWLTKNIAIKEAMKDKDFRQKKKTKRFSPQNTSLVIVK